MVIRRFERSSSADYHEMLDGNLRSGVIAARLVLPAMRQARFGRLVFSGMMARIRHSRCVDPRCTPQRKPRSSHSPERLHLKKRYA
jgi:hypothetical protein